MSGTNPFRRRDHINQKYNPSDGEANDLFSGRSGATIPSIDTDFDRPVKTKNKISKTVRIISPHSAGLPYEDVVAIDDTSQPPTRLISPPAEPTPLESSEVETMDDPFSAGSDVGDITTEDATTHPNLPLNAGNSPKLTGVAVAPENPFKRNSTELEGAGRSREVTTSLGASRSTKAQYDFDDFKDLLLMGKKPSTTGSTAAPPTVSFQTNVNVGGSSSNTDASSSSHQSLFEPASGGLQDSPRTSHEVSVSDEERQRLVGISLQKPDKVRPSTPRHRHGKLVKANAPQTVSFEDPTLSFPDTGATKPLPTLPSAPLPDPTAEPSCVALPPNLSNSESPEPPASPKLQKRDPPAPPPSRRYSQLRPNQHVSSPGPSSLISEEALSGPVTQVQPPQSGSSKPAPPPPRRSATIKQDSSSSVPTTASIATSSDQSVSSIKPPTPTPPTRSPSLAATKRPSQSSPLSGSPSMPPPPPPRRRGSSQSSYVQSRLSGDYRTIVEQRLRSDSGASSISQLPTFLGDPIPEGKDVLADLSALQREVDELRGKFRQ
ncbi:MAG: hypothetical protein Q9163_004381 [Psora crenata]